MVFANELDHWRLLQNNNNSKALRASSLQETAFYVALSDNGLATACNVSVSGDNASEGGNSPSALPATAAEATVAGTSSAAGADPSVRPQKNGQNGGKNEKNGKKQNKNSNAQIPEKTEKGKKGNTQSKKSNKKQSKMEKAVEEAQAHLETAQKKLKAEKEKSTEKKGKKKSIPAKKGQGGKRKGF